MPGRGTMQQPDGSEGLGHSLTASRVLPKVGNQMCRLTECDPWNQYPRLKYRRIFCRWASRGQCLG